MREDKAMYNTKQGLSDLKRSGRVLEVLEQRQLLSADMMAHDVNGDFSERAGIEVFGVLKKIMGMGHISFGSSEVCDLEANETGVLVALEVGGRDELVGGIYDTAKYVVKSVLQAAASSNEDYAFVQAEAVKEGSFLWNSGWTRSALISAASEFLADEVSEEEGATEDTSSRMERITEFLSGLPFALVGLYVMQHASSTTSVKDKIIFSDRVEEITMKPFTVWFVGGSLMGSTIGMLPQLYQHWVSGEMVDLSPVMKGIQHEWKLQHKHAGDVIPALHDLGETMNNFHQGTSAFDFREFHYSNHEPASMEGFVNAVVDMIPTVNVGKLSILAGEVIALGLMGMMENRAHEEGGVLVEVGDTSFFKFAYNAQYHLNYLWLRVFTHVAELFSGEYKKPSVVGTPLREIGMYGYMALLYFGSISSFYPTDHALTGMCYMMNVPRAMAIHTVGGMFNDKMNQLADWYEGV